MSKILALDIGEKRIGLALTDEIGVLAIPYKTIDRNGAIATLKEVISKEAVEMLVIGLPYLESGELGSQATDVKGFSEKIKQEINMPIDYVSELLSSQEAVNRLKELGERVENKGEIDTMAATILLEDYLRSKN